MSKSLKFILPLLTVLVSSNLEIANSDLMNYYDNYILQQRNNFTPSVELRGKSILENTTKVTNEELQEFSNITKDYRAKIIALGLSSQLLNDHFCNIKTFNYKYIQELGNSVWVVSYFDAMKNGLQNFINNQSKDKLIIESPFEKYNNPTLDDAANIYIAKISNNNAKKEFKMSEDSIRDAIYNFDALGFDKIFYKVVKGTLKANKVINEVFLDNKQTNNVSELENHEGICAWNASFSALQTSGLINSDFIEILGNLKKDKEELLRKNDGQLCKQVTKAEIPGGIKTQEHSVQDIPSVNIFTALDKYKKKDSASSESLNEILEKIKEHKDFDKTTQDLINKKNVDGLLRHFDTAKNNKGANSLHTLKVLADVLGIKDKIVPSTDNNTKDDDITCGSFVEGKISSINQYQETGFSVSQVSKTTNGYVISVHDTLTFDGMKHINKLPENMVIKGIKQEGNTNRLGSMKFDEKIHKYVFVFDETGDLAIGQLSSMAMNQKNRPHAVGIYIDKDNNYYMMDDNTRKVKDEKTNKEKIKSGYYKIEDSKKNETLNNYTFEYGIYKQIYRGGIEKDSKNKITSGIIMKENKKDNKKNEQSNNKNKQQVLVDKNKKEQNNKKPAQQNIVDKKQNKQNNSNNTQKNIVNKKKGKFMIKARQN